MCRVLGVSPQGYYQWRKRPLSARARQDIELSAKIRIVHAESKSTYGSPRIHDELRDQGIKCSRKRVVRLMQSEGVRAKAARKYRHTTDSAHTSPLAPDLVQRNFSTKKPNQVYVGDITYLWTPEGWLYLAVFIDLYSRMVVGWAIGTRLQASLATLALNRAIARRRPMPGLIVHTDQGSQYASKAFRKALQAVGAVQSMGSRGDCYDNAVAESFFHSLKIEAIYGADIETRREMEVEVFSYIERFYNKRRKHSTIGLLSPEQFEKRSETNNSATA